MCFIYYIVYASISSVVGSYIPWFVPCCILLILVSNVFILEFIILKLSCLLFQFQTHVYVRHLREDIRSIYVNDIG